MALCQPGTIPKPVFPGGKISAHTLLVIDRLAKPEFLIEIEAIARVPG